MRVGVLLAVADGVTVEVPGDLAVHCYSSLQHSVVCERGAKSDFLGRATCPRIVVVMWFSKRPLIDDLAGLAGLADSGRGTSVVYSRRVRRGIMMFVRFACREVLKRHLSIH